MYIVVVFAIITVANVLANRYNKSYDSTSNKRYSLSEQTAKIVKGLKQDATITYYDQSTQFQTAKDQLEQYANLSPKVHVEYVDVDKKPQLAREAGIKNYGTTIVQIGAKKEEAKSLTEEGITGAFIRDLKNTHAHGLLRDRQRRAPDRRLRAQRLFAIQRVARQGRLRSEIDFVVAESGNSVRLHGCRCWRPDRRLPAA